MISLRVNIIIVLYCQDIEVTTVLTTMDVDGMERDKPRMSLLLQDQTLMLTLMLMLMAGVSFKKMIFYEINNVI